MDASTLLLALGLMFVIEGIVPFVAPSAWRQGIQRLTQLTDGQIRFFGLMALLLGSLIFVVVS